MILGVLPLLIREYSHASVYFKRKFILSPVLSCMLTGASVLKHVFQFIHVSSVKSEEYTVCELNISFHLYLSILMTKADFCRFESC